MKTELEYTAPAIVHRGKLKQFAGSPTPPPASREDLLQTAQQTWDNLSPKKQLDFISIIDEVLHDKQSKMLDEASLDELNTFKSRAIEMAESAKSQKEAQNYRNVATEMQNRINSMNR